MIKIININLEINTVHSEQREESPALNKGEMELIKQRSFTPLCYVQDDKLVVLQRSQLILYVFNQLLSFFAFKE